MSGEIRTERLLLRSWRESDREPMAAINRDPEVTEFLNRPIDEATMAAFLDRTFEHWREHGFGHFALELAEGPRAGETIGFCGVAFPTFLPAVAERPELGWRLARSAWGGGYATEAARAARHDAFERLGLEELISIIHPDNPRSRRVAEKLGMAIEGRVHNDVFGRDVDIWRLGRRSAGVDAGHALA